MLPPGILPLVAILARCTQNADLSCDLSCCCSTLLPSSVGYYIMGYESDPLPSYHDLRNCSYSIQSSYTTSSSTPQVHLPCPGPTIAPSDSSLASNPPLCRYHRWGGMPTFMWLKCKVSSGTSLQDSLVSPIVRSSLVCWSPTPIAQSPDYIYNPTYKTP